MPVNPGIGLICLLCCPNSRISADLLGGLRADSGLQGGEGLRYTRRLFRKFDLRVLPAMEINPILNSIKDLSERTQTIRGYL